MRGGEHEDDVGARQKAQQAHEAGRARHAAHQAVVHGVAVVVLDDDDGLDDGRPVPRLN